MVDGAPAAPARILVVDDDREYLDFMATLLGADGFAVAFAHSLVAAESELREGRPDLLICDLRMPDAPPLGVLDRIGDDPALAAVPVLLCSGAAQDLDDGLRRLAGRPTRALLKPFDIDELLHCVRLLLRAAPPPGVPGTETGTRWRLP